MKIKFILLYTTSLLLGIQLSAQEVMPLKMDSLSPKVSYGVRFGGDLSKLIRAYQSAEQGYAARRAMLKAEESSDYDHLARYGEWSTNQRATIIKVSK